MKTVRGSFIRRRNRFVVELSIADTVTTASLPNPGRMQELLLPGVELICRPGPDGGKHPWRIIGVTAPPPGRPGGTEYIFLDTGATNRVAATLIEEERIPFLEAWEISRPEVSVPGSGG